MADGMTDVAGDSGAVPAITQLQVDAQQPGETVRGWAYRNLLHNIVNLTLPPGACMTEQELAAILRASRTPVREALIQLANDGFVEITSQKGTRVSRIDADQVEDDRFMRRCLEHTIAGMVCDRLTDEDLVRLGSIHELAKIARTNHDASRFFHLDEEFHQALCVACGKARVWDTIRKFSAHLMRARLLNITSGFPEAWDTVLAQHEAILSALRSRDAEAATAATEIHLSQSGWDIAALRDRFRPYFV